MKLTKPETSETTKNKSRSIAISNELANLKSNFSPSNVGAILRNEMAVTTESRHSSHNQLFWTLWGMIRTSKSARHHWYTGAKSVAIQAWIISFLIMSFLALIGTGGNVIWALTIVLIGIALEGLALIIIPLALLVDFSLGGVIPDNLYLKLILPVLASAFSAFIINRLSVFVVTHSKAEYGRRSR